MALPIASQLPALFNDPGMFRSAAAWKAADFRLVRDNDTKLMVAKHGAVTGYLFKKYSDHMALKEQLTRYTRRLEGAEKLRSLIDEQRLKHIVVPRKWLYELPPAFSRQSTAFVVVVEEIPVYDRDSDTSERMHHKIDVDVLRELCVVFYRCKGLDFTAKNAPFTRSGKIAFIDTEYLDWQGRSKAKDDYMKCAKKYLTGRRLAFAKDRWRALRR